MRQYVLTRSAYGPAWDIEANRRRLAITRAVTARLMAAQTTRDWLWIVLLDQRDPLLAERLAVYVEAAPLCVPLIWTPENVPPEGKARQRIAAADYQAPWRSLIPCDDLALMTRLDDDDGLAPDALARYRAAGRKLKRRTALMLPMGIRVWNGRYTVVRHESNAMHTLVTPKGDGLCVYDYGHTKVRRTVRVERVDQKPGWLWVRHRDTISGYREGKRPISDYIRRTFPVDWKALEAAWA